MDNWINWQRMEEFKRSDILVHLATEGGYEKYPKFKSHFNFNVLKSKISY